MSSITLLKEARIPPNSQGSAEYHIFDKPLLNSPWHSASELVLASPQQFDVHPVYFPSDATVFPSGEPLGGCLLRSAAYAWHTAENAPLSFSKETIPQLTYEVSTFVSTIAEVTGYTINSAEVFTSPVDLQPWATALVGTGLAYGADVIGVDSSLGIFSASVSHSISDTATITVSLEVAQSGLRSVTSVVHPDGKIDVYACDQFNIYKYERLADDWHRTTIYTTPLASIDKPLRATLKCVRWLSPYDTLLVAIGDNTADTVSPNLWHGIGVLSINTRQFITETSGRGGLVQVGELNFYNLLGDAGESVDVNAPDFARPPVPRNRMYAHTSRYGVIAAGAAGFADDYNVKLSYFTVNNVAYRVEALGKVYNGCGESTGQIAQIRSLGVTPTRPSLVIEGMIAQLCVRRIPLTESLVSFAERFDGSDRIEMAQVTRLRRDADDWFTNNPVIGGVIGDAATNTIMPFVEMELDLGSLGSGYISKVYSDLPSPTSLTPDKYLAGRYAVPSFDPLNAPLIASTVGQLPVAKVADIGVDRAGDVIVMAYENGELHYMSGPHLPKFLRVAPTIPPVTVDNASNNKIRSIAVVPNAVMFGPDVSNLTSTSGPVVPPPGTIEQPITCLSPAIFTRASADANGHLPFAGTTNVFAIEDTDVNKITYIGEHVAAFHAPGSGASIVTPYIQGKQYWVLFSVRIRFRWDRTIDGIIGNIPNCELRFEHQDGATVFSQVVAKNLFAHAGAEPDGGMKEVTFVVDEADFAAGSQIRFAFDLTGDANMFDRYTCEYRMLAVNMDDSTGNVLFTKTPINTQHLVQDSGDATLAPVRHTAIWDPPGATTVVYDTMQAFVSLCVFTPPNTTGVAKLFDYSISLWDDSAGVQLAVANGLVDLRETLPNFPTRQTIVVPLVFDPTLGGTPGNSTDRYRIDIKTSTNVKAVGDPRAKGDTYFSFSTTFIAGSVIYSNGDVLTHVTGNNVTDTNYGGYIKRQVAASTNDCSAIGVAYMVPSGASAHSAILAKWAPDSVVPPDPNFDDGEPGTPIFGISGLYTNLNSKHLWLGRDQFSQGQWGGFHMHKIPQFVAVTTTTVASTTTVANTWTGNWVYAIRQYAVSAFKDTQTATLALEPDEEGYGIAVADGPRIYFTTITASNETRLYWAPLDLSTKSLLRTYPNTRATDIAWDWNQQKLVMQDPLGRRIFLVDANGTPAGVVADADTPPYLQDVFGHMEVNPKSSLLYHNAVWGASQVALEGLGLPPESLPYFERYPSLIDLSKTIDSLAPGVDGANAFHARLFASADVYAFEKHCRLDPVASAFRPLRDMQSLPDPTTTLPTSTTGGSTTSGSSTTGTGSTTTSGSTTVTGSTTTGTGSTTTGVSSTTGTGSTSTTGATTTTVLGTTSGDTGCWTATNGVEMYPSAGLVRINQDTAQLHEIYQLVSQVPAVQVVLTVVFTKVVADTYITIGTASGATLVSLKVDAPGTYRLKYTPSVVSNLRVGVQVTAGTSNSYVEFSSASLRACDE